MGKWHEIKDAIVATIQAEGVGLNIHNNASRAINIVNSPIKYGSSEQMSSLAKKLAMLASLNEVPGGNQDLKI